MVIIIIIVMVIIIIIIIIIIVIIIIIIIIMPQTVNPNWKSLMPKSWRPQQGRQPSKYRKIIGNIPHGDFSVLCYICWENWAFNWSVSVTWSVAGKSWLSNFWQTMRSQH